MPPVRPATRHGGRRSPGAQAPAFPLDGTAREDDVFAYLDAHYDNAVHHPKVAVRVMGREVKPDFGIYLGHGGPTVVDTKTGCLIDTFIEHKSQAARGSTMSKISHTIETGGLLWDKTGVAYIIVWDFSRKAITDNDLERFENSARYSHIGFANLDIVTDPAALTKEVRKLRSRRKGQPKKVLAELAATYSPELIARVYRQQLLESHRAES